MTPAKLQQRIVAERAGWVEEMLAGIRSLPLGSHDEFVADPRNVASAESYLRRALEALLDLGRHVLGKGFGLAVTEYREIPRRLQAVGVLGKREADRLGTLAGYRNRMVHVYAEVTQPELYEICSKRLGDVDDVLDAILGWIRAHPEMIDTSL
jgi:uncharacterized protein YutE (UPF0331/DUF86 family)